MKVRIIPRINYFGSVIDYGQEDETGAGLGRIYDKDFNILTQAFTLDIKSPPRRTRRRGGMGSVPLTQDQIKNFITQRIKGALRRRVLKTIKDNLYRDISMVDEDADEPNSPPIKFYLEDYPDAKIGKGGTEQGLIEFIRDNFTTEFRVVRTNNRRAQNLNWGQERVFLKAPNKVVYDRDCFFQPSEDSDESCAYEYIIKTFSKTAGFKKVSKDKASIDFATKLPQQYQKDIYKNWLAMYDDDRHLEKFMNDETHPLPEIVDVEDLDDDLFKVIDLSVKHKYSDEEIKRSMNILDIIKWCIVANVRCIVLDYDNTYYCSYNPEMFVGVHKKVSTNNRRTIALKVANEHAYFVEDADYKKSLSLTETKYDFNGDPKMAERKKNKDEEKKELEHEYHLHPVKDVVIDFDRLRGNFPQGIDEWREVYNEVLTQQKLLKTHPAPQVSHLKAWAEDKDKVHHYSINQTNLNSFINLLHKSYGMTPENCIGGMNTIHFASYGNLRVYSNKRKPRDEWSPKPNDPFFKEYPEALTENGVEPTATKVATAIYNKEYKGKDSMMSMYNDQTRGMFYDAEIKPITRTRINRIDWDKPVYGWDLKKAYTTALESNTYKWNVYDSVSQPRKFRGTINPNWFYLCKNLTDEYPCKTGKGLILYHGCFLQHLKGKVLPKYELPPAKTLEPDHFQLFVEKCKFWNDQALSGSRFVDCFHSYKQLINSFIGFIKLKDGISNYKHFITTSKATANREIIRNKTPTRLDTKGKSWSREALLVSWATKHSNFQTAQPIRLQIVEMINEQMYLLWRHYRVCLLNYKFAYTWLNNIKQRKVLQKMRQKKSVPSKINRKICMDDKTLSIKTDCLYINSPFNCKFSEEWRGQFNPHKVKVMNTNQRIPCDGFSNFVISSWNKSNAFQISLECIKDPDEYNDYVATTGRPQLPFKFIPNEWESITEVKDKWELKTKYDWKVKLLNEGGRIEGKGGRGKSELINEFKEVMDRNKIYYKWNRLLMKKLGHKDIYNKLAEWRDENPCFYKVYAPTNKASNRVGGATLHKGLGIPFIEDASIDDEEEEVGQEEEVGIDYLEQIIKTLEGQSYESKDRKPSPCYDRIIVDEISMINGEGWSYLAYIHQRIPRLKFLTAGNIENQLPPVGEEYRNFENSLIVKELAGRNLVNLTYNFRIGRSSDVLWDEWSINPERFKINPNTPLTDRNLSYTNATRKNVINLIQDRLPNPVVVECKNEKDILDNTGQTEFLKYQLGTPLIARQSKKDLNIAKNEMYYVVGLNPLKLFEPETKNQVELEQEDLIKWFLSGYCITIHKSQGETYKDKYTIWDWKKVSNPEIHIGRRLRYVAQSRSTKPEENIFYR